MKILVKSLSVAIFSSIIFFGCKKNHNDTIPTAPLIKQLSIIFTGNPPTPSQVDFIYDGLTRVKRIFMYNGDSGSIVSPLDTVCLMDFIYPGSELLPSTVVIDQRIIHDKRYHYLTYTTGNQVIRDSVIIQNVSYNIPYFVNYSYSNNLIIANTNYPSPSIRDTLSIENGDINYYYHYPGKNVYEFDSKSNPLNYLNIASIFHVIADNRDPSNPYWSLWTLCNKNNITKATFYYNNSPNSTAILDYTYDSAGLPSQRIWRAYNTTNDTIFFKYR